jgi:signal transduction histidine kinase
MVILALYAGWLVVRNTAMVQWQFLETVEEEVEEIVTTERIKYLDEAERIAELTYISDKLYVYWKYWDRISPETIEFDIVPLSDFLEQTSLAGQIETMALYRRKTDQYHQVAHFGPSYYLPETLFQRISSREFDYATYFRYADGIYLRILKPVYDKGTIVGVLLIQKAYTASFFSRFASQFNVGIALASRGSIMFGSLPESSAQLLAVIEDNPEDKRMRFEIDAGLFYGVRSDFDLGSGVQGSLLLYNDADDYLNQSGVLIRKILIAALACILLPVITFMFWGSKIVASVSSLAKATTRISGGDLTFRVGDSGNDEFGTLRRNFNSMLTTIEGNKNTLEDQNEELRMKNAYVDAVFQSLLINIIVLGENHEIKVCSRSAESRLDLPAAVIGTPLFDLEVFGSSEETLRKEISEVRKHREFRRLPVLQIGAIDYEVDLYPVVDEAEGIDAVIVVLINISERIAMERALLRSDRLASVGQIAAGIAHEVNNPMSVIQNHVQLIRSGKLTKNEEDRFMDRISDEIRRVSSLIDNLLKFSREDRERQESCLLIDIIRDVLGLFDPKIRHDEDLGKPCTLLGSGVNHGRWSVRLKERVANVCLTGTEEHHPVTCSRDAVKQVFINIFKNALQAIDNDFGMIHINVDSLPEDTHISVFDNGSGISPGNLDKIFDPFYTSRGDAGTGLGLALSQSVLERMGGTLKVESKGLRGTTVTILIPSEEHANAGT